MPDTAVRAPRLPPALRLPRLPPFSGLPRLPDFTVPAAAARLLARLPQHPPTQLLTLLLNLCPAHLLPRDTLAPLTGRRLRLCVADAGLTLDFTLTPQGFQRCRDDDTPPDLTLRARVRDYLALALREEDADTLFFQRRLAMSGDTELGLLVKNTLDAIDWHALNLRDVIRQALSHGRAQAGAVQSRQAS